MIMRLILWLSVLWIAPLVVGVLVNDAKFKKNLAVGVTIPPEFQADPDAIPPSPSPCAAFAAPGAPAAIPAPATRPEGAPPAPASAP